MPAEAGPPWRLLEEVEGVAGGVLWDAVRDVALWAAVDDAERPALFHPPDEARRRRTETACEVLPELAESLRTLAEMVAHPGGSRMTEVAEACAAVSGWAELSARYATAARFAEAAARVEPEQSARAYRAGRCCRHLADHPRATLWFRRAVRLARLAGSNADYAVANLGWGNLEHDRGRLDEAERHTNKAIWSSRKCGRRSLEAAAYHNLMHIAYGRGKTEVAFVHAQEASRLYPANDNRLPAFVGDLAILCMERQHFSSALYLFSAVEPAISHLPEKVLLDAAIARAAAAIRDRKRYLQKRAAALKEMHNDGRFAPSALLHLAHAAWAIGDVEEARVLAGRAASTAKIIGEDSMVLMANHLLKQLQAGRLFRYDAVLERNHPTDVMIRNLLDKLGA